MANIKLLTEAVTDPKFTLGKSYEWEPEDIFEVSGTQFAYLLEATKKAATTSEGLTPTEVVSIYNIFHAFLVSGVESGIIKEKAPAEVKSTEPINGIPLP
jgi:hypothetical protein